MTWWTTLRADLEHLVERGERPAGRWAAEVAVKCLVQPRVRAVVLFRCSQVPAARGAMTLAYWLQARAIRGAGCEIAPQARIGPGLCLMHSVGIVVGAQVRVGRRARIYQGVTLGDGARPGQPTIGDDVTLGANACVLGPVRLGDRVVVGANAVVTRDVPDDCVATGAPASFRPITGPRTDLPRPPARDAAPTP